MKPLENFGYHMGTTRPEKIDPVTRKIDAIKALRQFAEDKLTISIGLKEAKEFLEALVQRRREDDIRQKIQTVINDNNVTETEGVQVLTGLWYPSSAMVEVKVRSWKEDESGPGWA